MPWAECEPVAGVPSDLWCPAGSRYVAGTPRAETAVFPPGRSGLWAVLVATHLHPPDLPTASPGGWRPRWDRLATQQTLLFQLLKQGQAGDAGPREDDVVLACRVPAQASGHHAVQLGLILQCVQPIGAPAFLQVDVNLE